MACLKPTVNRSDQPAWWPIRVVTRPLFNWDSLPLIESGLVDTDHLIADAKSGVSGPVARRKYIRFFRRHPTVSRPMGSPGHRHLPEIRQGLSIAAGKQVGLTFVPHLTPMIRGIHATLYAQVTREADFQALYESRYKDGAFRGCAAFCQPP
jgi:N-acetyl-gamma-glutamyl-phosphate reductase